MSIDYIYAINKTDDDVEILKILKTLSKGQIEEIINSTMVRLRDSQETKAIKNNMAKARYLIKKNGL